MRSRRAGRSDAEVTAAAAAGTPRQPGDPGGPAEVPLAEPVEVVLEQRGWPRFVAARADAGRVGLDDRLVLPGRHRPEPGEPFAVVIHALARRAVDEPGDHDLALLDGARHELEEGGVVVVREHVGAG